MHRST
ncbi:UNVERIFIED_CONTAM: hypothetical protein GTU68_059790 [Idotea baltica]